MIGQANIVETKNALVLDKKQKENYQTRLLIIHIDKRKKLSCSRN